MSGSSCASPSEWRSILPGMVDQLKYILASGEMSDVRFAVGRQHGPAKIFSVHKFVLSLGSDVFHTMFNGGLAESGDRAIDIPEILPEAFANMLTFLYTRTLGGELTADNVFETMYCADKYNLPLLMELCQQFINSHLNIDNCLVFWKKAKHSMLDCLAGFVEKCLAVVDAKCKDVLQSDQFSDIGQDTLITILQRSTLSAEENSIYRALEKWSVDACVRDHLEPSPANRRGVLGPALFLVRFPLMTDAQLANGPIKSGLLLDAEVRDIYQYKHSDSKPQISFPTEPRKPRTLPLRNVEELEEQAEVFVDVDERDNYWYPMTFVGMMLDDTDALVSDDGGATVQQYALSKIVCAADILKEGQKIICFDREVSYKGFVESQHLVTYRTRNKYITTAPSFTRLRISRDQMAAWKASIAQ
ncbi:BTB/POZ domain-containing protein 2-like [Paramacrobiotus metropolitanus]|uniref:BTB/POZ domain-containing protein 2-like n=1 Tax=Paramacrobiotus metropolitanus TaxID=2943436 RepID=UPI0024458A56|nr:BTB/POZ domain-containing protein 2-like [Paramacrobiotus metropolitanus]